MLVSYRPLAGLAGARLSKLSSNRSGPSTSPRLPGTQRHQRLQRHPALRVQKAHTEQSKLPKQANKAAKMPRRRPTIKFRTSFANTIYDVMTARGWKETDRRQYGTSSLLILNPQEHCHDDTDSTLRQTGREG